MSNPNRDSKDAIRAYVQDRKAFRHYTRRARSLIDRRVEEVARGLELLEHGPEIANRQRYGPWRWESDTNIACRVDDSFMGDCHIKWRVFHVRKLWK